jgi:hypothetical protein
LGRRPEREGRSTIRPHREAGAGDQHQGEDEVHHRDRARQVVGEGPDHGEGDDEDRTGDGDGADDLHEVATADVAPPLLVEPEGGEDDELGDDDEADRLGEEHPVAMRQVALVEEAQPEGQVEGERDEGAVGAHLENPVAVDGMVQPAHRERPESSGRTL